MRGIIEFLFPCDNMCYIVDSLMKKVFRAFKLCIQLALTKFQTFVDSFRLIIYPQLSLNRNVNLGN